MARKARVHSTTGIYHVMLRGINGHHLFREQDDDYCWSSWHEYSPASVNALSVCEKSFILDQMDLSHLSTLVKQPFESDGCYGLEEDGHPSDNDVHKMLFEMPQRVHFFP